MRRVITLLVLLLALTLTTQPVAAEPLCAGGGGDFGTVAGVPVGFIWSPGCVDTPFDRGTRVGTEGSVGPNGALYVWTDTPDVGD